MVYSKCILVNNFLVGRLAPQTDYTLYTSFIHNYEKNLAVIKKHSRALHIVTCLLAEWSYIGESVNTLSDVHN